MRYIDWIWHISGSLPLGPGQSNDDAFGKLDPLFRQRGTSHGWTSDTLTFQKTNQAPQDKLSIFDSGVLRIDKGVNGAVLHYRMASRALLFCFLAPLLFLGIAQLTVVMMGSSSAAAAQKAAAAKKPPKTEVIPQNPVDKFLGAPAPEKPKDGEEKPGRGGKKPSPTPAYVFAAIFATLYLVGRILEDRLVKSLFKKGLRGETPYPGGLTA